jgi:hypothetical protein
MSRPATIGRQIPSTGVRPPVLVVGLSSLSGPFSNLSVAGLDILPLPAPAAASGQCAVSGSPPRTKLCCSSPRTRRPRWLPLDSRGSSRARQVVRVPRCGATVCRVAAGSVRVATGREGWVFSVREMRTRGRAGGVAAAPPTSSCCAGAAPRLAVPVDRASNGHGGHPGESA